MTTFKNKSVVINTIQLVRSPKFVSPTNPSGARFLVNGNTNNNHWVPVGVVRNIFGGMGLDTKTTFLKLIGSTLNYLEYTVTPEELAAANGQFTVTTPSSREFTVTTAGVRTTDYSLGNLATSIMDQINKADLVFSDDWASMSAAPAAQPAQAAAPAPANAAPIVEQPEVEDPIVEGDPVVIENEADLDGEAGM